MKRLYRQSWKNWMPVQAGGLVLAGVPQMSMTAEVLDVIHLNSGGAVKGAIEAWDHGRGQLHLKVVMEGPSGRGEAARKIALTEICFVDFAQTDAEAAIADEGGGEGVGEGNVPVSLTTVRRLWVRHQPELHVPNSPAGDYGLACIGRLLATGLVSHAREAYVMAGDIGQRDWNAERRVKAKRYRLRAAISAGMATEARFEATQILSEVVDPPLLVEARLILGRAAFEELRELVARHPRWILDEEFRSHGESLFQTALDHSLYGSLFYGALRDSAAEGLWQACETYQLVAMPDRARAVASDLVELYSSTAAGQKALVYLKPKAR